MLSIISLRGCRSARHYACQVSRNRRSGRIRHNLAKQGLKVNKEFVNAKLA